MKRSILIIAGIILLSTMAVAQEPFNLQVEIPESHLKVPAGEKLLSTIRLFNLGSGGRFDVFLDYKIKDSQENVILKKRETIAVETQANLVRVFDIPQDTEPGEHTINVKLTYFDGREISANSSFEIIKKSDSRGLYIATILTGLVLLGFLGYKLKYLVGRLKIKLKARQIVRKRF